MSSKSESLGRRIFRDTANVSVVNVVGNVLVYFLTVLVAAVFGADWRTDALNMALLIPMLTSNVIRGAIASALVPVLVEFRVREERNQARISTGSVLAVGVLTTAVTTLLIVGAPLVGQLMGAFLPPEGQSLLTELHLILTPMLPLLCLSGALSAVLNTHGHFRLPAALAGLEALVKIVAVAALVGSIGIFSLAFGHVMGALAGVLFLGAFALSKGLLAWRPSFAELRPVGWTGFYSLLGSSLLQFNPFIDRYMASALPAGSVTALNYAERTSAIPFLLVGAGFFGVVLAHWSEVAASQGQPGLRAALRNTTAMVIFLLAPVTVLMIALRIDLLTILFQRGRFDAEATALTASAFMFLTLGMIPNYIAWLVQRVFLVSQDARTPMLLGLGNTSLNFTLNLLLIGPFGLAGIAFSTALTWAIVAVIGWIVLRRRIGSLNERSFVRPLAAILLASLLCGGVALLVQAWLPGGSWLLLVVRTGLAGGLGLLVYAGVTWGLGVEEARKVNFLTRRGLRKHAD